MDFSDAELLRYSRHILLEEFGVEGQQKLAEAHALVVGAGGLGSAALPYLAAAGVGKITISDFDRIDLTNLQRQVIYTTAQTGAYKAQAAAERLDNINPTIAIAPLTTKFAPDSLTAMVVPVDIILDCTDNFATRYQINRASVLHKIPLVSGAALGWQGQCAVFDQRTPGTACYQCLFPEMADQEEVRCSVMGVFSPVVAVIGGIQALEALKLLANLPGKPRGNGAHLLLLDGLYSQYRTLNIPQDSNCTVCAQAR